VDTVPFNPDGECQAGGLYFCSLDQLSLWLDYSLKPMYYAREVTVPDDAQVWVEKYKFKSDCLILGDRVPIVDLLVWMDEDYCLRACKLNGLVLQYVRDQTLEICLAAVKENGRALQYVKDQTEAINLQAVKEDGYALQYVRNQTESICLSAVRQNDGAFRYVNDFFRWSLLDRLFKF
jgi:hypothetical protein